MKSYIIRFPAFFLMLAACQENGVSEGSQADFEKSIKAVCGSDDRTAFTDPRVARTGRFPCTAWLVENGKFVTAGHCLDQDDDGRIDSLEFVEFNVPASRRDGKIVRSRPEDTYRILPESVVTTTGNINTSDWAVFEVEPNTVTGKYPIEVQGTGFKLSRDAKPERVSVIGYGIDGDTEHFGADGFENSDSRTQQSDTGPFLRRDDDKGVVRYRVDATSGNSGSPVIDAANPDTAIGIHIQGGCNNPSRPGANTATSFANDELWNAVNR